MQELTLIELQEKDEAPAWFTEASLKTLKGGYLLEGETPRGMYRRVSHAAANRLNRPDLEPQFFNILWRGWLGLATPVASNMGAERGLPISCFSSYVADTINDIFDIQREIAVMSAKGGGTAAYLGAIRPKNSPISSGGLSDGVTRWSKLYNEAIYRVSQGALRRGANALYLDIEHPDYMDFLKIRKPNVDPDIHCPFIHHAAVISDSFMHRLKEGDKAAREAWVETLNTRLQTGEPYLFFKDNTNNQNPPWYKALGLEVKQSNLCCLLGDELVLVRRGQTSPKEAVPISELVGETVAVWDGNSWVEVNNFESKGFTTELIEVTFENGVVLKATPNHRFPIVQSKPIHPQVIESYAADLNLDDEVLRCVFDYPAEDNEPKGLKITGLKKLQVEPTEVFCCTVPTTSWFALGNGLMTGNSEITLYTDEYHSLVCCLSSLNLAKYDEWKDTNTVYLSIWFLDAVMEEFIQKAKHFAGFERAVRFAEKSRALGLGVLGYHTYLQQNGWAFNSDEARNFNLMVFETIRAEADKATRNLAKEYGEPEWCKGWGVRNTHLLACAPTVSNSIICGDVSAGVEPVTANVFAKDSAKGFIPVYNKVLKAKLQELGKDDPDTWQEILEAKGSVAGLTFLSAEDKEVFRTARELDQMEIINQAADRQQFIDQGQSINLFFPANVDSKLFNKVHLEAWKKGLKALYYCRSEAVIEADNAARTGTVFTPSKVDPDCGCPIQTEPKTDDDVCVPCSG